MIRRHIIFHGRVQGVGFRWRAVSIATQLGLTGWVKNLYDGSVEMEVQGMGLHICRMINELQNDRFIRIEEMENTEIPVEDNEKKFSVQY
ncbi:MAG: acylphosphatase [Lachnospiraceae bacterium]